jgi:hypothetical protein
MRHSIRLIPASPGKYSADHNGSTIVTDSASPIIDAARAILAAGASDHDTMHVTCPDVSVIPQPLHRLAAPRRKPLQSDIRAAIGVAR